MSYEFQNLRIDLNAVIIGFPLKNGVAGFIFRHFEVGAQSPSKTGNKAFFNIWHIFWSAVTAQYNLFAVLMKSIKNMEEFFLCFFFAAEELNIVNHQHIYIAIEHRKFAGAVISNGLNKLVGKCFG